MGMEGPLVMAAQILMTSFESLSWTKLISAYRKLMIMYGCHL